MPTPITARSNWLEGSCLKSDLLGGSAEGARYDSQGKHERSEARHPWISFSENHMSPEKGVIRWRLSRPFRPQSLFWRTYPGATRFALAPGYHISRLWRSKLICGFQLFHQTEKTTMVSIPSFFTKCGFGGSK